MQTLKWFVVVAAFCLSACNYTVGQCWIDDEGNNGGPGAGGGPVVPYGGAGGYGYGDEPGKEPQDFSEPPECNSIGSYSSSLFKFKTEIADDPSAPAGGWQVAEPTLKFVDARQDPPASWTCTYRFGIPLRTVVHGKISASDAAEIAAEVATLGSSLTRPKKAVWVPADFCNQFITDMRSILSDKSGPYVSYGAKVQL